MERFQLLRANIETKNTRVDMSNKHTAAGVLHQLQHSHTGYHCTAEAPLLYACAMDPSSETLVEATSHPYK